MKNLGIAIAIIVVCSIIAYMGFRPSVTTDAEANGNIAPDHTQADSITPPEDVDALLKAAKAYDFKIAIPLDVTPVQPVIYGDADAPIVIEEFSSFSCPHCATFHRDMLPRLKKRLMDSGLVRLHAYSFIRNVQDLEATMLVYCQDNEEGRKRFRKALFNGQEQWLGADYQQSLRLIARVGGMDDAAYEACVSDQALQDKLAASLKVFNERLSLDATPYFRMSEIVVKGARDESYFEQRIRHLLSSTKVQ